MLLYYGWRGYKKCCYIMGGGGIENVVIFWVEGYRKCCYIIGGGV